MDQIRVANEKLSAVRPAPLTAFRYDVVRGGAQWVIANGGPTWRGHLHAALPLRKL